MHSLSSGLLLGRLGCGRRLVHAVPDRPVPGEHWLCELRNMPLWPHYCVHGLDFVVLVFELPRRVLRHVRSVRSLRRRLLPADRRRPEQLQWMPYWLLLGRQRRDQLRQLQCWLVLCCSGWVVPKLLSRVVRSCDRGQFML